MIQCVIDALRPKGLLRAQPKSAPFGKLYGMDYVDLVSCTGMTVAQVKAIRDKFISTFPALKQFAKDHQVSIITSAQQPRHAPGR